MLCALLLSCNDDGTAAGGEGGAATSGSSSATGGGTSTGVSASTGAGGGAIEPPAGLVHYVTGNPADVAVTPAGPALILMGGGSDVDEAFQAWVPIVQGGDVVVLRTSGADGYNHYLHADIGGVDSVETMLVTTPAFANSDYVADRLARAEAIFMAGGDQATYVTNWKGTRVEQELEAAWARGAVIGGTSAGCAVLGEFVFTALNDTVYSDEALADPYNRYMTLDRHFLGFPPMVGVVTDTHFAERDRMGRLVAFSARAIADGWAANVVGLGIDEATALWVDGTGAGTVLGAGSVYVLRANGAPEQCVPGQPLQYGGLELVKLVAADTVSLPGGQTTVAAAPLSASGGVTVPSDPY
jgi:cyanophycinase